MTVMRGERKSPTGHQGCAENIPSETQNMHKFDVVPQLFKAAYSAACDRAVVPFVEVIRTEVAIGFVAREHVVDNHQQAMGNGDHRFLLAAARCQAPKLRPEIGVLRASRAMCGFNQRLAQPLTTGSLSAFAHSGVCQRFHDCQDTSQPRTQDGPLRGSDSDRCQFRPAQFPRSAD